MTIPFQGILKLNDKGTQPVGVKRALFHAGFKEGWETIGDSSIALEVLGAQAVANLKKFQTYNGLTPDGVYGPASHKILQGSFDAYGTSLYLKKETPKAQLQLPATFTPTHQTAGLPGYPAVDVFAAGGSTVGAPEDGTVTRLSGHNPNAGGPPGGAYGWSIYLTCASGIYYMTHFLSRTVTVGQKVKRGDIIGKVGFPPGTPSHIHEGKHKR